MHIDPLTRSDTPRFNYFFVYVFVRFDSSGLRRLTGHLRQIFQPPRQAFITPGEVSPAGEIAAVMGLSAPVWLQPAVSRIITDDRWAGAPAFLTRSRGSLGALRETHGGLSLFAGRRSGLTATGLIFSPVAVKKQLKLLAV